MKSLVTTIGLEVHVQLRTESKLFSPAANAAGDEPNVRVHPIDLGLPGVLPLPNQQAVLLGIRAALALEGDVRPTSEFARKHYFYPDLPKGYQISQYEQPYCEGGRVPLTDGRFCPLVRIHLEEDAGKLTHTDAGTLIDLNRAGVPLVEIVSEPALHTADDAYTYLVNLRQIMRFAGVSDCDMEHGSLRCDANVSVAEAGAPLGTKVEVKNLNSFKMVQRAIEYEERRQTAVLAAGGEIVQETRLWNDERAETRPMRSKEFAEDYRYFPDPDLPTLTIDPELVERERQSLGELPGPRRQRYREQFGLPDYDIEALTQRRRTGDWFERLVAAGAPAKAASNWVMGEVSQQARQRGVELDDLDVGPDQLAELLAEVEGGTLTLESARRAFVHMLDHGGSAKAAIDKLGLAKITDEGTLGPLVDQAIADKPQAAADVRAGKAKARDALKGQVMRATRGKADPSVVDRLLDQRLS